MLKTDLFDEALGTGLYPALDHKADQVYGVDISLSIKRQALVHYPRLKAAVADVRHMPFANASFDVVVSISTFDHFHSLRDIGNSLSEVSRILVPGGRLILTLDNLQNPLIALRGALSLPTLNYWNIVPYFVGVTCGHDQLTSLVQASGLSVLAIRAILHCPRVLAVPLAGYFDKHCEQPSIFERFARFLRLNENLEKLPTRFLTGHYVALLAEKPL